MWIPRHRIRYRNRLVQIGRHPGQLLGGLCVRALVRQRRPVRIVPWRWTYRGHARCAFLTANGCSLPRRILGGIAPRKRGPVGIVTAFVRALRLARRWSGVSPARSTVRRRCPTRHMRFTVVGVRRGLLWLAVVGGGLDRWQV